MPGPLRDPSPGLRARARRRFGTSDPAGEAPGGADQAPAERIDVGHADPVSPADADDPSEEASPH